MKPMVVDLYHGDELAGDPVQSFRALKAAGILGVIHKATQGVTSHDPLYAPRRAAAREAGLLWGAYDFNSGDPVEQQVDYFLSIAQPDEQTLLALDLEDNTHSQMSLDEARAYLSYAEQKLGRKLVLYSGNRAKDLLGNRIDPFFGDHRLWLCQYGPVARLQPSWTRWWLWQFTGDGVGPGPHALPGIKTQGIDINTYAGTPDELAAEWAT